MAHPFECVHTLGSLSHTGTLTEKFTLSTETTTHEEKRLKKKELQKRSRDSEVQTENGKFPNRPDKLAP